MSSRITNISGGTVVIDAHSIAPATFLILTDAEAARLATSIANLVTAGVISVSSTLTDPIAGTVRTTDATATVIATYIVPNLSSTVFRILVTGRKSGGSQAASFELLAGFRRTGATVTQVGADALPLAAKDDAGWTVATAINGVGVEFKVTGAVGDDVQWKAAGEALPVTHSS